MNRDIRLLVPAQFLSAFGDNALLFTAIEMAGGVGADKTYVTALQASFIVAYVVLAAWVGPFADTRPKTSVLVLANVIKAAGVGLMFAGTEPLIAYALVGVGAVMYSPAKYGILPEMVAENDLVRANAWVEGATIAAIILGMLLGSVLAERSVPLSLTVVAAAFAGSGLLALLLRKRPAARPTKIPLHIWLAHALREFRVSARQTLRQPRGRFALLNSALFWAVAALLRLVILAWAPLALAVTTTSGIAELTLWTALGIAAGAILAPRYIGLDTILRVRYAAWAMGLTLILLAFSTDLQWARAALFLAGVAGGLFITPINAVIQEIGHRGGGSGAVVGVQRFLENIVMLLAMGGYAVAVKLGVDPVTSLAGLGALLMALTGVLASLLKRHEDR